MPDYTITVTTPDGAADSRCITISGAMTIPNIAGIKDEIKNGMEGARAVELRLDGVTNIDVTGLQLLCSVHRTCVKSGPPCSLNSNLSDAVYATAAEAGFLRHAGCVINEMSPCIWCGGEQE